MVLGTGHGTFGKPVTSPLLSSAINNQDLMLTGDFNADGKPDLVIMDDYSRGFQVLLGNGDGSFQAPVDTTVSGLSNFAVGDFNSDGKTDLVVTTGSIGQVLISVYLSNGDGTFKVGSQYSESYGGLHVADVNRDGHWDLVVASFGQPLLVLLGNGDGTFKAPSSGPIDFYSGGLVVGDFNGDGKPDISVGTYNGIAFLAGNADGTFQKAVYSNSTYQFCCQMVSGDVNGDGKLDLVTIENGSGVLVMAGKGNGTFQSSIPFSAPGQVYSGNLVLGDFNSDGVEDIGLANQDLHSQATLVSVYLSTPTVVLYPSAIRFGAKSVGTTSAPVSVNLTNSGNSKLNLSNIAVSGDFTLLDNCGKSLAVGQNCTLRVSFKPTAMGTRNGTIVITDSATTSPQAVTLKGSGK